MGTIYVLTNTLNGKSYVGQTVNKAKDRYSGHRRSNQLIGLSIRECGWENFKINNYFVPDCMLDYFEKEMIRKADSIFPNGYNVKSGGSTGNKDSFRKTLSIKARARVNSG